MASGIRVGSFLQSSFTKKVCRVVSMRGDRVAIAPIDGGIILTTRDHVDDFYTKLSMREAMRLSSPPAPKTKGGE